MLRQTDTKVLHHFANFHPELGSQEGCPKERENNRKPQSEHKSVLDTSNRVGQKTGNDEAPSRETNLLCLLHRAMSQVGVDGRGTISAVAPRSAKGVPN